MDKIIEIETEHFGVIEKHILIDHGNGAFTSMLKSVYEEQQAAKEANGTLS